jgi:signal transduction histidine kinase
MKGDYVLITSDDGELVQILTEFDVIQYFHQHNEGVLTEVKSKFQEINQNRSEFLQHVSHELRTPLASIIGFSDVLLKGIDGELNERMDEDIRSIRASGVHLRELINDLIDISKIETGRMELRYEAVDLHEILYALLDQLREVLQVKGLDFHLNFDEKIGMFRADGIRVRQILHNIVGNAIPSPK